MAKVPVRSASDKAILREERSSGAEIASFLEKARTIKSSLEGKGRIVFALDATMSRQPTWDLACNLQSEMFDAVSGTGSLSVQLVYYRGYDECRASRFVADGKTLKALMQKIDCRGGQTQIRKVLKHALEEHARVPLSAVIFIGDAMEENVDELCDSAGRLGMKGVPIFAFQEGRDHIAETALREIARLSRGAWFRFDHASAATLARLLSSIAVYATGGLKALQSRNTQSDQLLIGQMSKKT